MKKIIFVLLMAAAFCVPVLALADAPVNQIRIISAAQTIATSTPSSVFTIEAQDSFGNKVNVATTTRVSLASNSLTGQFLTSPASGPCGTATTSSISISNGTSHKSFCYTDSTSGTFTLTISVPDQPLVLGDFQAIVVGIPAASPPSAPPAPSPEPNPTPLPNPQPEPPPTTTPPQLTQSYKIKIYRFLPNPSGGDSGNEWIEIKSQEDQEVLLDGWFLDDKDTGAGPAGDSFVLSGIILPGEVKKFMLPADAFALNNTGGDEVNLYFANKTLADKAEYFVPAYDDGIFELRDGIWQPPVQPQQSSGGGGGGSAAMPSSASYFQTADFKINEIFPNAAGDDAGKEWIEIYNPGSATATLDGYFLAGGESDAWSQSAWLISSSTPVAPLGVAAIILPKEAFSLKNSGKEKVKLFSPQKQLLDFVVYENAPEGQSYFKDSKGLWRFGFPTFNKPNIDELPAFNLFISEVLPNPNEDEDEFVEVYNPGDATTSLENFVLQIGTKKKVFEASDNIAPKNYFAIYEDDLPVRLRNSGQTITLIDLYGRQVSQVKYDAAKTGMAYASDDGKVYAWTQSATPAKLNEFVLGAETTVLSVKEKSAGTVKASLAEISKAQGNEILQSNEDLKQQLAVLQESVNNLQIKLEEKNSLSEVLPQTEQKETPAAQRPISQMLVFSGAFSVLGSAVYIGLKRLKK